MPNNIPHHGMKQLLITVEQYVLDHTARYQFRFSSLLIFCPLNNILFCGVCCHFSKQKQKFWINWHLQITTVRRGKRRSWGTGGHDVSARFSWNSRVCKNTSIQFVTTKQSPVQSPKSVTTWPTSHWLNTGVFNGCTQHPFHVQHRRPLVENGLE